MKEIVGGVLNHLSYAKSFKHFLLKSVCSKIYPFSFCRANDLDLEKCSRNELFTLLFLNQTFLLSAKLPNLSLKTLFSNHVSDRHGIMQKFINAYVIFVVVKTILNHNHVKLCVVQVTSKQRKQQHKQTNHIRPKQKLANKNFRPTLKCCPEKKMLSGKNVVRKKSCCSCEHASSVSRNHVFKLWKFYPII